MNTRQQRREGAANERQEDNVNREERDNLIAALQDQSEALTAISTNSQALVLSYSTRIL
jgi:hypothetical protein